MPEENENLNSLKLRLRQDAASAPIPRLLAAGNDELFPAFDVYQPNSAFPRTAPGLPDFYVAVTSFSHPTLSFDDIQTLIRNSCRGIPLKIATVSDSGTVVMFGITSVGVPLLIDAVEQIGSK